jgi:prepilin signal peptidase PulO-like enzyme (type II secretory pathway)
MPTGEILSLVSVVAIVIAMLFLPWMVAPNGDYATFSDLLANTEGIRTGHLLPVAAAGGGLFGLIGLFAPPKYKRALSVLVLLFGLAGSFYYISFFVRAATEPELAGVTDLIGAGFWVVLVGVALLVIQAAFPRGREVQEYAGGW